MRLLVTCSLRRSGQHAVINWICSQSGTNVHLNNVDVLSFEGHLRVSDFTMYKDGEVTKKHFDRHKKVRWEAPNFPVVKNFDLCVLSFEDRFPQYFDYVYRFLGYQDHDIETCIILRDPYNLFASRLHTYRGGLWKPWTDQIHYTIPDLWRTHASFCVEPQKYGLPLFSILFNKWCTEEGYRRKLAKRIGVKFTDRGFKEIPMHGESMFTDEDPPSTVLTRWKLHKKEVLKHIDKDTAYLSRQLFGEIT